MAVDGVMKRVEEAGGEAQRQGSRGQKQSEGVVASLRLQKPGVARGGEERSGEGGRVRRGRGARRPPVREKGARDTTPPATGTRGRRLRVPNRDGRGACVPARGERWRGGAGRRRGWRRRVVGHTANTTSSSCWWSWPGQARPCRWWGARNGRRHRGRGWCKAGEGRRVWGGRKGGGGGRRRWWGGSGGTHPWVGPLHALRFEF